MSFGKNPKVMVVQKDVNKNKLEHIESFLEIAKKNDCDFIVFPEYAIGNGLFEKYNHEETQLLKTSLQDLARKYEQYIVIAFLEKQENVFYNCGFIINKKGEFICCQKKCALLPGDEKNALIPGKEISVVETEFGKISVLICRDFFYPELTNEASRKGAKIIFCPMHYIYWSNEYEHNKSVIKSQFPIDSAFKALTIIPQARAIENEVFFVTANAAGNRESSENVEFLAGHSIIAAPLHGKLQQLSHYDEGFMIQELNFDIIEDSKNTFALTDNKPEIDKL